MTQPIDNISNVTSGAVHKEHHTSYNFSMLSLKTLGPLFFLRCMLRFIRSSHLKHIKKKIEFLQQFLNVMRLTQRKTVIGLSNLNYISLSHVLHFKIRTQFFVSVTTYILVPNISMSSTYRHIITKSERITFEYTHE